MLNSFHSPMPFASAYSSSKAAVSSITDTLYMECLPLGIAVVLLSPGLVQSTMGPKMFSAIPANTSEGLYAKYMPAMATGLTTAFGVGIMGTEEFARRAVESILSASPPRFVTMAPLAGRWRLMEWLPREWVLRYLWWVTGEGSGSAVQSS